jgi:hypothetical protein
MYFSMCVTYVGDRLWQDESGKSLELIISDGLHSQLMSVHQIVLSVSSPFFRREMSRYMCWYELVVKEGNIPVTIDVIKYLYTSDISCLDGHSLKRIQDISVHLEIPYLYGDIVRFNIKKTVKRKDNTKVKKKQNIVQRITKTYFTRSSNRPKRSCRTYK